MIRRIMVSKVGGLGDSLSLLPALDALRRGLPAAEITVLCSPTGAEVFAGVEGVRLIAVPRPALSGVAGLRRVPGLAAQVGRVEVALMSHDETTVAHLVAAAVAPRRLGFAAAVARGEALLTDLLPFDPQRGVVDLSLDLVRQVVPEAQARPVAPPRGSAARFLDRLGVRGPYGVIHPGAATALQRWPHFSALAAELTRRTDLSWLTVTAADGLSLAELAAVIDGAVGFVGNHSGPLHVAAACGRPWVAIAGPTAPAWDPPWGGGRVVRRRLPCQPCGRLGAPAKTCRRDLACLDVPVAVVAEAMVELLADA